MAQKKGKTAGVPEEGKAYVLIRAATVLREEAWTIWTALILTLAASACGFILLGGQGNVAMTEEHTIKLLKVKYWLEAPSHLVFSRGQYPQFWHSHILPEFFWSEVWKYFLSNFLAWWAILIGISMTRISLKRFHV